MRIDQVRGRGANSYIVDEDGHLMIIDVGLGNTEMVMTYLRDTLQRSPSDVQLILCTHSHFDHMGGLWQLAHRCQAELLVPLIQGIKRRSLLHAIGSFFQKLRYINVPVSELVAGGIIPGFSNWQVIHTPGHTDDSYCFYHAGTASLISGDTLLGSGRLEQVVLPLYYRDRARLDRSISELARLQPQSVYPGHGSVISGGELLRHLVKSG